MKTFKRNSELFLVFIILIVFFIANQSVQDVKNDKLKECNEKSCRIVPKKSTINNEKPEIFFQNVIKSEPGNFYRFIVKARIVGDVSLNVMLANSVTSETVQIGTMHIKDGKQYLGEEILFKAEKKFDGIVLQKKDPTDNSEVFIQDLRVSLLNVKSEQEMENLRPSILGSTLTGQRFIERSLSSRFINQINKSGILFGRVFKAQSDSISSIVFDPEILTLVHAKQNDDFVVELRQISEEGGVFHLGSVLESIAFSIEDIHNYLDDENKVNVSFNSYISEEKYYYVGIRTKNAQVLERNYIDTFGEKDSQYFDGRTIEFTNGQPMETSDNLYFEVLGFFSTEYLDEQFLSGAIFEDLGRGVGSYAYRSLGNETELLDVVSPGPDIRFDDDKKVVYGRISDGNESFIEYRFDTTYPLEGLRISARQVDVSWKKVSLFTSFDQKNWNKVPWEEVGGVQYFSQEERSVVPIKTNTFYLKVVPNDKNNGKYGIKDLMVEAKLKIP